MKTAYILHGACDAEEYFEMDFPSPSNAHWLPWLQQKFLRAGFLCQTPEMPKPYAPDYQEWCKVFKCASIAPDSIVVAHSAGAGFFLRWLKDNPQASLSQLLMVAPWLDPYREHGPFLQGAIPDNLNDQVTDVQVFISQDDPVAGVRKTHQMLQEKYPQIKSHRFNDKGHFCLGDIGPTFPELWHAAMPDVRK